MSTEEYDIYSEYVEPLFENVTHANSDTERILDFFMSYLKDNFLLENKTAEKLYFDYACGMPIFDYHCHLPEKQILENKETYCFNFIHTIIKVIQCF